MIIIEANVCCSSNYPSPEDNVLGKVVLFKVIWERERVHCIICYRAMAPLVLCVPLY